ncbi:MAG: flavodoxin family protein [Planctomycetota bacterium]|jgi:multimeric flavodoxin WrbA
MKVIGINGSPRKGGNTETIIRKTFEPLKAAGIQTELIQIGGKAIRGCTACGKCADMQNRTCVITKDPVNEIIQKMIEADGMILGSPTYFADVSAEMKAVFDTMNHFFQISGMFIVGSTYWNMCYGLEPGDVNGDEEGMANMTDVGESMAFLLNKLKA